MAQPRIDARWFAKCRDDAQEQKHIYRDNLQKFPANTAPGVNVCECDMPPKLRDSRTCRERLVDKQLERNIYKISRTLKWYGTSLLPLVQLYAMTTSFNLNENDKNILLILILFNRCYLNGRK